jgi:hypothetical protein
MKFDRQCRSLSSVALLLAVTSAAMADDIQQEPFARDITLGAEADDADGRQLYAIAGFPLGHKGWTDLSLGQAQSGTDVDEIKTTVASLAVGVDTSRINLSARYTHREDSDSFREQDVGAKLTLLFAKGSLGMDVFFRSAESETIASVQRRRRDPLAVRVTEAIDGHGIGLHGELQPSEYLTLSAGFMKYDYQSTTNRPNLLQRLALAGISVVTRDQAFFDSSARAGATYSFESFDLTLDYYLDRALETGDEMHTGQLTASIPVGERWMLTPTAGYSTNDPFESSAFAGFSMSVLW